MKSSKKNISDILHKALKNFIKVDFSGEMALIISVLVALIWANSPWSQSYFYFWNSSLSVGINGWVLNQSFLNWINDGLMAIFFFFIGLEIKREILAGELSSPRKAMLPLIAALGGMVMPAALYLFLNRSGVEASGWGVPMATDITFALGVLMVIGKHIPLPLKIFLTAFAIADDLGAVLVIALFYTSKISWVNLGIGTVFQSLLIGANILGIRRPLIYAILGIGGLWLAFLFSGIHATIAGMLAAFAIPAKTKINASEFLAKSQWFLEEFKRASSGQTIFNTPSQQSALYGLGISSEQVQPPLQRLERSLQPWILYFIIPLFALANAGVSLRENFIIALQSSVTLGIILGLVVGKPLGIFLFSWVAVKMKIAVLPKKISWQQLFGIACLGGIGFTMSLFIANLAFGESFFVSYAKVGIFLASIAASVMGWFFLKKGS